MERLRDTPELLDGPLDDPETLAGNLRDLSRVNRLLGGVGLSRAAIDALGALDTATTLGGPGDAPRVAKVPLRLIDIGTGAADIPLALLAAWQRRGRGLQVTAVDRQAVLDAAVRLTPALLDERCLELCAADGRSLPFPDDAFDIAHASLVLHHLESDEGVAFLREAARVARVGVVINDLDRTRAALLAARVLTAVTTSNRYTRNDAPLSVRRAYRLGEAQALIRAAGLRVVHARRHPLFERWAVAAAPA